MIEEKMHDDVISRQAVINTIHNYWKKRLDTLPTRMTEDGEVYADIKSMDMILEHNKILSNMIKQLPSAQPERKKGNWILIADGYTDYVKCDQCGNISYVERNFCPSCGADMRGEQDE